MRSVARIVLFVLLVAALPLRGLAAAAFMQCEMHHGAGALLGAQEVLDHGAGHDRALPAAGENGDLPPPASSACNLCAGCCVGSPVAPDFARAFAVAEQSLDRTPFAVIHGPGHVPGRLDRPPLAL
jgi:hypothetical protein